MKRKISVLIALTAVLLAMILAACTPALSARAAALTADDAKAIAVAHAGLVGQQVSRLHANYEIDDGVPQYDVEFYHNGIEYSYEIHADTGTVLSFEKDR